MKKYKRMVALLFACAMMMSLCDGVYAVEAEVETSGYLEEHFQINFTNISIEATVEDGLSLHVKNDVNVLDAADATGDIARLEDLFERYENLEVNLARTMSDTGESLLAVSFTEVPLQVVDGHYERIPASTNGEGSSTSNGRGSFLFYTTVNGGEDVDSGSNYNYYTNTIGEWSTVSLGNDETTQSENGYDYVLQTSPNTFSRVYDTMTVTYQTTSGTTNNGISGSQFWRENGDETYSQYRIDDYYVKSGFGRFCKNFTLYSRISGPKSGERRMIRSYYVHTWDAISLSVSVSASTDKGVALTLTPSSITKSWQVYNYVSFMF